MAKIEIKTEGTITKVFVDGKIVNGVRKLSFSQEPGQVPILRLDLITDKMTINSPALLALPEVYEPFYESKSAAPEEAEAVGSQMECGAPE